MLSCTQKDGGQQAAGYKTQTAVVQLPGSVLTCVSQEVPAGHVIAVTLGSIIQLCCTAHRTEAGPGASSIHQRRHVSTEAGTTYRTDSNQAVCSARSAHNPSSS
jgi:hypothetical protein